MLFPEKMTKIRIYSTSSKKDKFISLLHKKGILHIEEANIGLERFNGFDWYKEISYLAVKFRGIASLFGLKIKDKPLKKVEPIEFLIRRSKNLISKMDFVERDAKKLKDLKEEKEELLKDYLILKKYESIYSKQVPKSTELYVAEGSKNEIQKLKKYLEKQKSVIYLSERIKKKGAMLIVASVEDLSLIFDKYSVKLFIFPKEGLKNKINKMKEKIMELEKEEKKYFGIIEKLKEKYSNEVIYLLRQLEVYSDRANVSSKFKGSKQFFVVEGWIPSKKFDSFIESFNKKLKDYVYVEKIRTREIPPTLLNNPKDIEPFERIVDMISLPRGDQLDPTFFFSLTIPLLYGMIIGDVFYSIMAMGFAYWLGKKFNKSKMATMASKVWILSSLGGIIWGVIFDEWFGVSHYFWLSKLSEFGVLTITHPIYQGFSRTHFIPLLMLASIILGALHLIIGFLIGAYSEMRHSMKHAIGKIGFAIFLFDLLLLIPTIAGYLSMNLTILYGLLALSIGLVFYGEGAIGLMELPTAIGNTISYIRIAAVGLVGVILAELINEFFAPTPAAGILNIFLMAILLSLHFFNAIIAMFEGIIQGGRLNVVEFGTKVYKGGGRKYNPFSLFQKYL